MTMSEPRPFTAATDKLAYAQAFAGPDARRTVSRDARRSLTHRMSLLRRWRRTVIR